MICPFRVIELLVSGAVVAILKATESLPIVVVTLREPFRKLSPTATLSMFALIASTLRLPWPVTAILLM